MYHIQITNRVTTIDRYENEWTLHQFAGISITGVDHRSSTRFNFRNCGSSMLFNFDSFESGVNDEFVLHNFNHCAYDEFFSINQRAP